MANNQIALLAQTPVFDTPFESQGKALQLRQLMNAGQAQDMELQQKRQAMTDDAATRDVFSKYGTADERIAALYKVAPKAAMALEKSQADLNKDRASTDETKARTGKIDAEAVNLKMQQRKNLLNTVNDPQSAAQWVAGMFADSDLGKVFAHGGDTPEKAIARIPTDPQGFAKWKKQSGLSSDKLIEYTTPNANTVANNQTSIATNSATNAQSDRNSRRTEASAAAGRAQSERVSIRSDERAREFNGTRTEENRIKAQVGKAPTEFQGKSAAFGARAEQADKIISSLDGKYSPATINSKQMVENAWLVGGALGAATNKFALTESDQKAEQAQRDFINAVLRQESGAAIGESEFSNAKKQYFPQPGDDKGVIVQKAKNRKLAIQGFMSNAGKAAFSAPEDAPAADIHSQADAILRGK